MRTFRFILRTLCAAMLLLVLASWGRSLYFLEGLRYIWGFSARSEVAQGGDDPDAVWTYHQHAARLGHDRGRITFAVQTYISYANTPDSLERWREHCGWERDSLDNQRISMFKPTGPFFDRLTSFDLWGLGTESFARQGVQGRYFSIPHALVGLVLAVPLASPLIGGYRRKRRRGRGRCETCGYDLSGSSGCPECGSAPAFHSN